MSDEKRAVLLALGAEVVTARADVEPGHEEGYIGKAETLARERCAFAPDSVREPRERACPLRVDGPRNSGGMRR